MTFLIIAQRELIAAAHRKGTYRLRWGVALSAAAVTSLILLFSSSRESGQFLYGFIGTGCLVLAGLAGLFLTSDSIAAEKRDGTLGLLYLTELGPFDVLLGKLMALGVNAVCALLAVFPVLSLALILGGLTGGEVVRTLLVGFNVLFVSLCAGLAMSAWDQRQGAVVGGTAAVLGGLLVWLLLAGHLPVPGNQHCAALSPLVGVREASDLAYRSADFWGHLGLGHLTGWGLLALAALGLRQSWRRERNSVERPTAIVRPPRPVVDPVRMGDLAVWGINGLFGSNRWPRRLAWGGVILPPLIGGLRWVFGDNPSAAVTYGVTAFVTGILMKGVFAWQSVAMLGEARRTGALELLLSTPVTDRELRTAHSEHLKETFGAPFAALYALDWGIPIAVSLVAGKIDETFAILLLVSLGGLLMTALHWRAMTLGGLWWGLNETRPTVAFAKNYLLCTVLSLPLLYFCCIGLGVPLIMTAFLTAKLRLPLRVLLTEKETSANPQ